MTGPVLFFAKVTMIAGKNIGQAHEIMSAGEAVATKKRSFSIGQRPELGADSPVSSFHFNEFLIWSKRSNKLPLRI